MFDKSFLWSSIPWLMVFFIGLITFVIIRQYRILWSLPPGPVCYPIFGNMLDFLGKDAVIQNVMREHGKVYKNMFSYWLGTTPYIIVNSWDLCKEALLNKKNDFSGRKNNNTETAVLFSDFGQRWETLRKLFQSSMRDYYASDKLADCVSDVVDKVVNKIVTDGTPVEFSSYARLITFDLFVFMTFGQRYNSEDKEFVAFSLAREKIFDSLGVDMRTAGIPLRNLFYRRKLEKLKDGTETSREIVNTKFQENKKSYQTGILRNFADALLLAKEESEKEGKKSSKYFTDRDLSLVSEDFFTAGADTTTISLTWLFLLVCTFPEVQKKMRDEIIEIIGLRAPKQHDKRNCHYVSAVIAETLRLRQPITFTFDHVTTRDTEIGGYKIPKNIPCLFPIHNVHTDERIWKEPEVFRPERFLDVNGEFNGTRVTGYMPFSLGRRACPGEKLALTNLFLIVTRFLQTTTLELEGGPGSVDLNPEPKTFYCKPPNYKVAVTKRISIE